MVGLPIATVLSSRADLSRARIGFCSPSMTQIAKRKVRLMLVAGEPSGDAHAAHLVNELREVAPDAQFEFFGSTGAQMRAQGVNPIVIADDLAILGLVEIGRALPKFWSAFRQLKHAAIERRPDAVILVDWPDFNLRLARSLHRRGLKIIYYISPQLWAWREYRTRNIGRDVDLLLSILPFEKDWFAARGVSQVKYVGHPLAGEVQARYDRAEFSRRNGLDSSRPIVALLPGSRHKEVVRILPPMLGAASVIAKPRDALSAADAAAVASGTATLEAALLGTPLVIVYKESRINWHTLGRLITAEHYGLANLIAGRRLVTELIQDDLNAERLAKELLLLIEPERNRSMRADLHEVAEKLGEGGASRRAADEILSFIQSSKTPRGS